MPCGQQHVPRRHVKFHELPSYTNLSANQRSDEVHHLTMRGLFLVRNDGSHYAATDDDHRSAGPCLLIASIAFFLGRTYMNVSRSVYFSADGLALCRMVCLYM